MVDILESSDGETITFTANTTEGDEWMREVYGINEIAFSAVREYKEAVDFKDAAADAGLRLEFS